MEALLVIDFHTHFLEKGDFSEVKKNAIHLVEIFKENKLPVIAVEHINHETNKPFPLDPVIHKNTDKIYSKNKPSAFKDTDLQQYLISLGVTELIIIGFNMEYCILFNAIIANELGFKVTVIEDACATVNNSETYEMPGLDINDFVSTVLHWSDEVEVLMIDEYV
ncbi:isochorismatase family cysteine hydrolase [Macrococcus caseolyticus]|uniref:cysteine hydrolase family protein n=1 Tax=Macrococcoides caseolyticum TaxID=69966 RepID=UPI0024BC0F9E|nr:isochorismatase family cysteine hydrolase [Macrococcus caseolyticus]MDJ1110555.1 isochorismatase family cysteine hydrolase [Macrococcus caseolyticus]